MSGEDAFHKQRLFAVVFGGKGSHAQTLWNSRTFVKFGDQDAKAPFRTLQRLSIFIASVQEWWAFVTQLRTTLLEQADLEAKKMLRERAPSLWEQW